MGGSWGLCRSAAAQGACSCCCCCCCCRSRRRRHRRCRQVLSGLLRHRGRCSRHPARPAARSKGAERAGGWGARGRAGMGRGLSGRPRRGAGLLDRRREERGWGSGGTGRLPSTPAPRAQSPRPGPAPAAASPANQKPIDLHNTARDAHAPAQLLRSEWSLRRHDVAGRKRRQNGGGGARGVRVGGSWVSSR